MRLLKQSTARSLTVFMVDSTDHISGKTGLTLTITASKDGGSFASITPTVTELSNGWYKLALTTSHTDTLGDLAIRITGTGADPLDFAVQIVEELPGVLSNTGIDSIFKRDMSSITGEAARSLLNAIRFLRNKWSISGTTLTVTKEDDTTSAWTTSLTTDAAANPVIGSDPA